MEYRLFSEGEEGVGLLLLLEWLPATTGWQNLSR